MKKKQKKYIYNLYIILIKKYLLNKKTKYIILIKYILIKYI